MTGGGATTGAGAAPADGPVARLTGLVGALRDHGFGIGTGETVDAGLALEAVGFADRERMREALAATLLHGERQRPVFDRVFDLYFPATVTGAGTGRHEGGNGDGDGGDLAGLRTRLAEALAAGDTALLDRLAAEAVAGFGGYGSGPGSDGWSSHQTLSRLRPETLLARVRAARTAAGQEPAFTDRLLDDEIRRAIEGFRERVRTEARRRVAERQGRDRVARRAVAGTADRVDFLLAGREQLDELRRTVRPLARKLATRLAARRRRAARGEIDLRRTLRSSLSTGGVPVRPVLRRRRPGRPELVLLCDVSGSVAGFAQFTMALVQALRDQFSRVRVFAFVNRVDEVTDFLAPGAADPAALGERILAEARLTGRHGQSDYGTALDEFVERYADALG
ncbi:VWA domain-containing protein, partial [Streptomyces sp. NPDC058757]|uniref:VWA domain-containing protein n=1 Tax=Streptomyces sp. NPDC058757 TaxID=3346626 RepID=UPI0036B6A5EA